MHLRRHGGERFRLVRHRRGGETRAVAHAPRCRRPGPRFRRCAQAKPVCSRCALPCRAWRCVHRVHRVRMDARAVGPLHRGKPARLRALSAAHALHRGLLRRRARQSCRIVDVAVPAVRAGGDRICAATGLRVPGGVQPATSPHPAKAGLACRHRGRRPAARAGCGGGAHSARFVLSALDRELDRLRVEIPVSDLAHRRKSVPPGGRDVGRLEERLFARCRGERAALDRRFRGGDAQHGAAHALRRPGAGSAIVVRRRTGVSADRQARHRPPGAHAGSTTFRRCANICVISRPARN